MTTIEYCEKKKKDIVDILDSYKVSGIDKDEIIKLLEHSYYLLDQSYKCAKAYETAIKDICTEEQEEKINQLVYRLIVNQLTQENGLGEEMGYLRDKFMIYADDGE